MRSLVIMLPVGLILLGLFWGLVNVVVGSFMSNDVPSLTLYADFFSRASSLETLWRTIWMALLTAGICAIIAYPVAYFIARHAKRRDLWVFFIILPWLVSLVVRTFGWIVLLGNSGIVNGMLRSSGLIDAPLPLMFNMGGVITGLVHVLCPFMLLSILSVFFHLDKSLEEASMSLRAGPLLTFWKVTLPLTMPGVMSGFIIVYLVATGAIVTPLMLGGIRDAVLGTRIYHEVTNMFNFPAASSMAVILSLVAFAVVLPLQWIERYISRNIHKIET